MWAQSCHVCMPCLHGLLGASSLAALPLILHPWPLGLITWMKAKKPSNGLPSHTVFRSLLVGNRRKWGLMFETLRGVQSSVKE